MGSCLFLIDSFNHAERLVESVCVTEQNKFATLGEVLNHLLPSILLP